MRTSPAPPLGTTRMFSRRAARRPGRTLALVALLAVLLAVALWRWQRWFEETAIAPLQPERPSPNAGIHGGVSWHGRVLILCVDGLDWEIVLDLANRGQLPHLAALMENGAYGPLRSEMPMISDALWTTVATGKPRAVHGITNFVQKREGSYAAQVNTSTSRAAAALWNIASDRGKSVGVVRFLASYPAEPVDGFVVSDRAFELRGESTYPEDTLVPVAETVEATEALVPAMITRFGLDFDPQLVRTDPAYADDASARSWREELLMNLRAHLHTQISGDLRVFHTARRLLAETMPDLAVVYALGIDRVCHRFWQFHAAYSLDRIFPVSNRETQALGEIILRYYQFMDAQIGELLTVVPADAAVMVVSDHGFQSATPILSYNVDLNRILEALGYCRVQPGPRPRNVDMAHSRAFNFQDEKRDWRGVYLNVAGREPQGIVPRAESSTVRDALASALRRLRTDRGHPLCAAVQERAETQGAGGQQWPDIEVLFNPLAFADAAVRVGDGTVPMEELLWVLADVTGEHRQDGVCILSGGPSARGGLIPAANLYDVAPTVLALLGLPQAADMPGGVIAEAFAPGRFQADPRFVVQSYEQPRPTPAAVADTALDSAGLETLRALGYVR